MNTDTKIARIVGTLFLVSMTVSLLYTTFYSSFFDAPLADIYPNRVQVTAGAFLELSNCVAVIGIAVMLFSILKRHSERLALCYVALRTIECSILIVGVIAGLSLITLSQEYLKAGALAASHLQAIGIFVVEGKNLALQIAIFICGLGGLLLTSSLYQTKLIPRFLSAWGFVGYFAVLMSAFLDILGVIDTTHGAGMMFYLPGGLFEMVLFPMWLIVKGFDSAAIVSKSTLMEKVGVR
jgi:hypothetical protein